MNRRLLAAVVVLMLALSAPACGEAVTDERVDALPPAERAAWRAYVDRSRAAAAADAGALAAEVKAAGVAAATAAPSGGDFKLPAKGGDPWYSTDEAKKLADVILSYQTPTGGWSKHTGYARGPRQPGMQWTSQSKPGQRPHYLATFDNRSTTEQLYFLAYLWHATKRDDCRAGFERGLDYVLAAQFPNGGWPQVYPLEGKYHDDVTFNDDAMTHVLELLRDITGAAGGGSGEPYYAFVDDARRARAAAALKAGIACVLKTHVEQGDRKTAWCAQYDPLTLQPSNARAMEPATLSGTESAGLLEFLMSIEKPSPEVVAAVEAGLAWLEGAKVTGLKRNKRDGKTVYDPDPASTEVYWARFYDLKTGRPVFPGRDGVLYDTFEAMAANNKLGYDYYSTQPGSIINRGQKKWRKMLAQRPKE